MASLKTCFKCGIAQPLDEFYKHPMMGDGHLGKCKKCTRRDMREHRAANLDRIRQYDSMRAKLPHRIALRNKTFSEAAVRNPNRIAAARQAYNALKRGAIQKWPCWVCGATKVEAHHPNYDAPLDVIWLCIPHHRQVHAMTRIIDDQTNSLPNMQAPTQAVQPAERSLLATSSRHE